MGVGDFVILAAVAAAMFFAVRSMVRTRRKGGCAGCPGCNGYCAGCDKADKR